ncbi:hypothetical protein ACIQVL_03145 [Streptomyces sp. NPDC090499]|uniref:hypothetical protein n=1 Tax=Streptomyces sp. NPDC090499 TaxID=3365965 RepID=UPI00382F4370
MTPYERLMAEAIPTGRFGDPVSEARPQQPLMTTEEQQAARRAALLAAQSGWRLPDPASQRKRQRSAQVAAEKARAREASRPRHLRIVPDPNGTQAA